MTPLVFLFLALLCLLLFFTLRNISNAVELLKNTIQNLRQMLWKILLASVLAVTPLFIGTDLGIFLVLIWVITLAIFLAVSGLALLVISLTKEVYGDSNLTRQRIRNSLLVLFALSVVAVLPLLFWSSVDLLSLTVIWIFSVIFLVLIWSALLLMILYFKLRKGSMN